MLTERRFRCPYCNERISCLLDASAFAQDYVEDCEVCCRPIEITCDFDHDGKLTAFAARRQDG
jgi:transcription elongation factor Elf1